MIPLELATGAIGLGMGAWAKLNALKIQAQRAKSEIDAQNFDSALKLAAGKAEINLKSRKLAMSLPSSGPWVRRFIACVVFTYLFVAPFLGALLPALGAWLGVELEPIAVFYPVWQETGGIKIFGGGLDKLRLVKMHGIVITPFHTHIGTLIGSFYFGGSVAGAKK